MGTCSKCEEPSKHNIVVREPPAMDGRGKNRSPVTVLRFCDTHWEPVKECLQLAA